MIRRMEYQREESDTAGGFQRSAEGALHIFSWLSTSTHVRKLPEVRERMATRGQRWRCSEPTQAWANACYLKPDGKTWWFTGHWVEYPEGPASAATPEWAWLQSCTTTKLLPRNLTVSQNKALEYLQVHKIIQQSKHKNLQCLASNQNYPGM